MLYFKRKPFKALSENFDKMLVSDFRYRWSKNNDNSD